MEDNKPLHPVKKYWNEVKAGLRPLPANHGIRGKDKNPRPIPASKTLATRYHERTGRRLDMEMEDQRIMVDMMFRAAAEIPDATERFQALNQAQQAMADFNKTWLPYTEQKLGALKSEQTLEEKQSLDDILNDYNVIEDKSNENK